MNRHCFVLIFVVFVADTKAENPPALTTLSQPDAKYTVPKKNYVILHRGPVRAVIVNNEAVDDDVLPGHRAGYSGIASLTHEKQPRNLFVPSYAGLNFEHIHDGTTKPRDVLFEPRRFPMQLRVIDQHTVELYQKPTPNWGLESVHRYHILEDGTLEMTFECIPRENVFRHRYIGLFWASYINQPESFDIHFRGYQSDQQKTSQWIRGVTPKHGVDSTHRAKGDDRVYPASADFPLSLVFHYSKYRYAEPWYFGVSHNMAFVQIFRPQDTIRLTQSPSGGGKGNPAWDFQHFIPDYKVNQRYQLRMRAMYIPYQTHQQIEEKLQLHQNELSRNPVD